MNPRQNTKDKYLEMLQEISSQGKTVSSKEINDTCRRLEISNGLCKALENIGYISNTHPDQRGRRTKHYTVNVQSPLPIHAQLLIRERSHLAKKSREKRAKTKKPLPRVTRGEASLRRRANRVKLFYQANKAPIWTTVINALILTAFLIFNLTRI